MTITDLSKFKNKDSREKKLRKLERIRRERSREHLVIVSTSVISIFTRQITRLLDADLGVSQDFSGEDGLLTQETFDELLSTCNMILKEMARGYGWDVDNGEIPAIYTGQISKDPEADMPTYTFAVGGEFEEEILSIFSEHNPEIPIKGEDIGETSPHE